MISSAQTDPVVHKRERPRPYNRNAWHAGDVAKVLIDGREQQVAFAVKQKYGGSRSLVMANAETMKELFGPDGETSLPLPPFSAELVVSRGPTDVTALARFRVPGHWDLPNLKFADTMRPELTGYFAQFRNIPEASDDPDQLERLGFKPPAYFMKQYYEGLALSQNVDPATSRREVATPVSEEEGHQTSSREFDSHFKPNASETSTTKEGGSLKPCGNVGPSVRKERFEGLVEDFQGKMEAGEVGKKDMNNGDRSAEPLEEGEEEEEEVENALADNVPSPKREFQFKGGLSGCAYTFLT